MKSTLTRNVRRTSRGKSLLMTLRLDQRYGLQGRKASKSGSRAFDRIPDSCDTAPARLQRWRSRGAQVLGDAPKVSVRQPKVMREACDAESFERMYSELRHRFHAVAYSILGNKEDAEDGASTTRTRILERGREFLDRKSSGGQTRPRDALCRSRDVAGGRRVAQPSQPGATRGISAEALRRTV